MPISTSDTYIWVLSTDHFTLLVLCMHGNESFLCVYFPNIIFCVDNWVGGGGGG